LGSEIKSAAANRLAFADLLRGLAALIVVLGHFTILFLTNPHVVATITAAEPSSKLSLPPLLDQLNDLFNVASMGVAVFFLISGFVIPLSLEGTDVRAYFLKRFLRIFPTYWIALAMGVAAIFISATFWSKPIPHDHVGFISNTFLGANAFSRADILSVAWTLQIEIKFYLLAPFIYLALKRRMLLPVMLCGLAITGIFWNATALCDNVHVACWDHYRFGARMLWFDCMFIIYMLIGSVFYALYRKLVPTWQGIAGILFLFVCYQAAISATPLPHLTFDRRLPYIWGLIIFAGTFLLRDKVSLPRPFRFLADISYSLYLVHPLIGYVTMRLLIYAGVPYLAAFAVALPLVIAIASAMHFYAEVPLIALGKRLSKTWFGARKRREATVPEAGAVLDSPAFQN
jgi:peptidoglycan/LPS O-acetylase OafA/YrhL